VLALYDLFNSTDGIGWQWLNDTERFGIPWNFSGDPRPCTQRWQGVTCTYEAAPLPQYFISEIMLSERNLRGPLPASISLLSGLASFSVAFNFIDGTIPTQLGSLPHLRHLDLFSNFLSGTIPASLTQLHNLSFLDLGGNILDGTISSNFGQLSNLTSFSAHVNYLTGTVPAALVNCTHVRYLNLGSNLLSGPIPDAFGTFTKATQMLLYVNALTGTIPASLSHLSALHDLDLGANLLEGTIPAEMSRMSTLRQLFFDGNQLTGTVPSELSALTKLRYLYLRQNTFTGSLPNSFGAFADMIEFIAYDNRLTGTIPDTFAQWARLQYLDVGYNGLHGTIGDYYGDMRYLQYYHVDDNHLSGTIPAQFGNASRLVELLLYGNNLRGPLPTTLSQLAQLETLLVQYNELTGTLHGVFNASLQTLLVTVKVNNNQFSGQLDAELLQLPFLTILVAGSNCFSGTIPEQLCRLGSLETLSLDGLSSASNCRNTLLPGWTDSYLISDSFSGTLPACLLALPGLNTLHLSGINLAGTLPSDAVISPALIDLALSHNLLTGSIPRVYQEKVWYSLDLSYNRLSGSLKDTFSTGQFDITDDEATKFHLNESVTEHDVTLSLENNRLSGRVPGVLQTMQNVSILGSNLFSCDLLGQRLPQHDGGRHNYQCGSTTFDIPYYLWLVLVGGSVVLWIVLWRWSELWNRYFNVSAALSNVVLWYGTLDAHIRSGNDGVARLGYVGEVNRLCALLCRAAVWCTLYAMCILLPLVAVLSVTYGTLTHQYTYTLSAAFLSGAVPAALQLVFFVTLLTLLLLYCRAKLLNSGPPGAVVSRADNAVANPLTMPSTAAGVVQIPVSGTVVAPTDTTAPAACNPNVNDSGSATITEYSKHPTPIDMVEAAVKSTRNAGSTPWWKYTALYTVFTVVNLVVVLGVNVAYVYVVIYVGSDLVLLAQVLVAFFKLLWNGVGTSHLVRWTTKRLIHNPADHDWRSLGGVSHTHFILLQVFIALFNNIAVPCIVVAVISPSCFSQVFSPAPEVSTPYTYEICENLLHGSCIDHVSVQSRTTYTPSFQYSYQCSSSIITYYAPAFVALCVITSVVTPLLQLAVMLVHRQVAPHTVLHRVTDRLLPRILKDLDPERIALYGPHKPYFHVNRLLILLIAYLGLLLTFGAVFPLLALCFTVTLLSLTAFTKVKVGRFLNLALQQGKPEFMQLMNVECQRAGAAVVVRRSLWMVCAFSCVFYTLFVFDTLGDKVGFGGAYWVLIAVPMTTVLLFMLAAVMEYAVQDRHAKRSDTEDNGDIELDVRASNFGPR
jgi:hypothetical protein